MPKKILIVDDAEINRGFLKAILEENYTIEEAENGMQALKIMMRSDNEIAAILLDLHMPEMSGFELLGHMKTNKWIGKIPVLVITGERSVEVENKCFELGVSDFILKPFEACVVKNRVKNVVELFDYKKELEEKVEKQTVSLKVQYQTLQKQAKKLKESNEKIVEILGTVVECRNLESGEHIQRVKKYTELLAYQVMRRYPEYNLTEDMIRDIVSASALHDLGKIAIPDKILLKPGKLTKEEFDYMKSHTTRGCSMLNNLKGIWTDEYRNLCYAICRYHHERYDGNGYPDGLKGEEIPIAAQIVSVADVYDALVSERIYKNAYTKEEAFLMIINGDCGVFSPKMMECFRLAKSDFENCASGNL